MAEKVSEQTGREAVDAVTRGGVEFQKELGIPVPSATKAEEYARKIVSVQIKKHEEDQEKAEFLPKHLQPLDPSQPKSRIDRGEVGEDTQVFTRSIGTASIDASTGLFKADDPHGQWRIEKPREDVLLRSRLDFLGTLPEWKSKLEKAAWEGEAVAKRRDHVSGLKERMSIIADHVIEVVETSNAIFGDWRNPKAPKGPKIILS